jgi:hypothetical protein
VQGVGLATLINDYPIFLALRPINDPQTGLTLVFEFD